MCHLIVRLATLLSYNKAHMVNVNLIIMYPNTVVVDLTSKMGKNTLFVTFPVPTTYLEMVLIILNSGKINISRYRLSPAYFSRSETAALFVCIYWYYVHGKESQWTALYTKRCSLLFLLLKELKQMVTMWGLGSPSATGDHIFTKRRKSPTHGFNLSSISKSERRIIIKKQIFPRGSAFEAFF